MNRWSESGVLDRILRDRSRISTVVKVHPDGTGALKKTASNQLASPAADGQQNFI